MGVNIYIYIVRFMYQKNEPTMGKLIWNTRAEGNIKLIVLFMPRAFQGAFRGGSQSGSVKVCTNFNNARKPLTVYIGRYCADSPLKHGQSRSGWTVPRVETIPTRSQGTYCDPKAFTGSSKAGGCKTYR